MSNNSKVLYVPEKSANRLIWDIVISIVKIIVEGIVAGICTIIPILGWIISICCVVTIIIEIVTLIIEIVGYSRLSFYLTDSGIYYKNTSMDTTLTFDQIKNVYNKGKVIMIETNIPKKAGSDKTKVFQYAFAADAEEFCKQYQLQVQRMRSEQ